MTEIGAFLSFFIIINILDYYKISKKLSILTDVMSSAGLELVFFMIMFVLLMITFAFMGFIMLGNYDSNFRDFS